MLMLLETCLSSDPDTCFALCERLLHTLQAWLASGYRPLHTARHTARLVDFLLGRLGGELSGAEVARLQTLRLGCQLLGGSVPSTLAPDYSHLVLAPGLMFEQLIMNAKTEVASGMLQQLRQDIALGRSTLGTGSHQDITQDEESGDNTNSEVDSPSDDNPSSLQTLKIQLITDCEAKLEVYAKHAVEMDTAVMAESSRCSSSTAASSVRVKTHRRAGSAGSTTQLPLKLVSACNSFLLL